MYEAPTPLIEGYTYATRDRQQVVIRSIFHNRLGRVQIVYEDDFGHTEIRSENRFRKLIAPLEEVKIITFYPETGNVFENNSPVRNSIYGVENLIQVRVTLRGGKIVKKELI